MKLVACVLLVSGFFLTLAALVLFSVLQMRLIFVSAALAVEALGVWLLTRGHKPVGEERP